MKTKMKKMVIKSVMVTAFMFGALIWMGEKPSSAYSVLPYYDPIDGTIKDERIFSNSKVTGNDTTWSGTRICTGEVTIDTRVTVNGDVKLILADSCKLTIPKGITVEKGNSLTIYAMENGEGHLYAGTNGDGEIRLCDDGNAGIGGTRGKDCTEKGHDGLDGDPAWWERITKVNRRSGSAQIKKEYIKEKENNTWSSSSEGSNVVVEIPRQAVCPDE